METISSTEQHDDDRRPPLPPAKGVPAGLKSVFGPTPSSDDIQDPADARDGILGYTKEVLTRLRESVDVLSEGLSEFEEGIQKGADPTKDKTFLRFVRETLAEVHGRYITTGRFTRPGLPNDEGPDAVLPGTLSGAPEENVDVPAGLDPMLAASPAARLALSMGADLMADTED